MAVAPYRSGQLLGWLPPSPGAVSTTQVNAAANWFAISFVPDSARTLSEVSVFVSAIAGTLGGSDITADLYDSTGASGAPGSALADTGKVPTSTITAAAWYRFTGFTVALTAGQNYWIVFKNVNGVPATNNCTFRFVTNGVTPYLMGSALNRFGWGMGSSTNSGSTWAVNATRAGCRIAYADGSYDGMPISNSTTGVVGDGVYAARESGIKFTSPANASLRVYGASLYVGAKTGSPTGNIRLGLWTGPGASPVNQGYAGAIPSTSLAGSPQWISAYFASPIVIPPSMICRITLGESTQSDASTNRYNMHEVTWDTDANSQILLPWNGTATKTYFDGSSWTDSPLGTSMFGHALLLDTAGEFGGVPLLSQATIAKGPSSY